MNDIKSNLGLIFRFINILIPIFAIKILENYNSQEVTIILQLLSLGIFTNLLLTTDFHRIFFINKASENISNENTSKSKISYLQDLKSYLIIVLPLIVLFIKPISIKSIIFVVFFITAEKIFDETQRYIQCCNKDASGYTKFIFIRRIIHLFPILLILLDKNYYLQVLAFSSILSILVAWISIRGFRKGFVEIRDIFYLLMKPIKNFNQYLTIKFISQPIAAFGLYSLTIIPLSILSNENNLILSNYSLSLKISLLPLTIYKNISFINNRNKILKYYFDERLKKLKLFLEKKIQNDLLLLFFLVIIINIILLLIFKSIHVFILSILVSTFISYTTYKFEIFNWKFNAVEKTKILIPCLLLNLIILLIDSNQINLRIVLFSINLLLILGIVNHSIRNIKSRITSKKYFLNL